MNKAYSLGSASVRPLARTKVKPVSVPLPPSVRAGELSTSPLPEGWHISTQVGRALGHKCPREE